MAARALVVAPKKIVLATGRRSCLPLMPGAPGAGDLMGKAIATGQIDDRMTPFAVDRFDRDKPVRELGIVLATD